MDINALIGKNLKRLREARGLSQVDLARRIETTPQRLSSYEVGRDGMGKEYMERVCRVLNVKPWEFFVDESTPIVKDERDREYLDLIHQAQAAGVAEEITRYGRYMVSGSGGDARDGGTSSHHAERSTAGKKARVAHRRRRAG